MLSTEIRGASKYQCTLMNSVNALYSVLRNTLIMDNTGQQE